jgi:hypothetical protein
LSSRRWSPIDRHRSGAVPSTKRSHAPELYGASLRLVKRSSSTSTASSAEFALLWRRYDLRYRRSQAKAFDHPEVGDFTLTYEVLNLEDGLRLSILQAEPGTADHDALKLLVLARTP